MLKAPKTEEELEIFFKKLKIIVVVEEVQSTIEQWCKEIGIDRREINKIIERDYKKLRPKDIRPVLEILQDTLPNLHAEIIKRLRMWV